MKAIFEGVAEHPAAQGDLQRGSTNMDATPIAASPRTVRRCSRFLRWQLSLVRS